MSYFGKCFMLIILTLAISASVAEKVLKIPLLEVGELWVESAYKLNTRLVKYVSSFVDLGSPWFYLGVAVLTFLAYHIWALVFRPINRVRLLGDLGYLPDGKFTQKEIANSVKKRRAVGEIPPVYPNGWFGIYEAYKLKNGDRDSVAVLGKCGQVIFYVLYSYITQPSSPMLPFAYSSEADQTIEVIVRYRGEILNGAKQAGH